MAFLGFEEGLQSFDVSALEIALWPRFGLRISGIKALSLAKVWAEPRAQIWRGRRAGVTSEVAWYELWGPA